MAQKVERQDTTAVGAEHRGRSRAVVGLLAGLVAAILMILMMALLRSVLGISPPPEMIPDRIAPLMPIGLFFTLIGLFGGYNELKQFGVGSMLLGQIVVGMLFGLLYARLVERGQIDGRARSSPLGRLGAGEWAVVAFVAGAWLLSLALLWPVLGSSYRGLPIGPAMVVTALGLLLAYAGYGAGLVLAYRFMTRQETRTDGSGVVAPAPVGRRAVLVGGAGLVLALASGGLLRRLFGLATFSYDGLRYDDPSLPPLTPNDAFYTVTKNVVDPSVDPGIWRLDVTGMVDQARTYRFEDLAEMAPTMQETTLMCISNGVGDALMSNAAWKGVPLRELIAPAGPRAGVVEAVLHGVDGYTDTIPIAKALEPTTLAVYEMNGEPLPERHGYPVRLIVPGMFGEKNVKWVTRVELVDRDVKGFYEQQGWGPDFAVPTRSRIFTPDFSEPLRVGQPIALKGIVFGGDRGISRAEISLDDGQSWQEARLEYPGTRLSWAIWGYEWRPTQPGEYRLAIRGFDASGAPQPAEEQGIVPIGARGYHRVTAQIVA